MAKTANDYLKTSRIPYLILDGDGVPVEWNAYAETLLSISGKNPAGKGTLPSIREIVLEQSTPGEIERFDTFLAGHGLFFSCDFTRQKDTDTLSWYRLNVHRQEENRFFALIDDITPQIIKETHLIEAKENAEKASLNRSQFLANISHEIRTPIQTIIGMSELLAETRLDEEQTEYARQVRFSADVLLTLINDILDITKVEAGKLKIEAIDFDPVEVIEGTVDLVAMEAHKKSLEVNIDISTDIPAAIVGDPNRLQQVLLNLVKNAVKFTETGNSCSGLPRYRRSRAFHKRTAGSDTLCRSNRHRNRYFRAGPETSFYRLLPGGRLHNPEVRRNRAGALHITQHRYAHGGKNRCDAERTTRKPILV